MKIYKINILKLLLAVCIYAATACTGNKPDKETGSDEHGHNEATESAVTDIVNLTEIQYNNIGIELGALQQRNLKNIVRANGVLDLPPQKRASVSSYIGGIIKNIFVIQGDYVKKGQRLASLEHPDIIETQEEYLRAKSSFILAEKEYRRQKQLFEEKIIASKKLQQAEAEYQEQRAILSSYESKLRLMHISPSSVSTRNIITSITITAPISGYVNHVDVNIGSVVDPSKEIFDIVDNSHVHVDLQVFENDLSEIKVGQKVHFTLSNYPGQEFIATIFAVGKAFDNENKSVEVHADMEGNKDKNLMPGMYVNGRIEVGAGTVSTIPNDAIISEGELKYVFIKLDEHTDGDKHAHSDEVNHDHGKESHKHAEAKEDDHEEPEMYAAFKRIEIKTGVSDMGFTEIISLGEMPKDAQIVTKGAYYLSAQLRKGQSSGGEDEHGH